MVRGGQIGVYDVERGGRNGVNYKCLRGEGAKGGERSRGVGNILESGGTG